MHRILLERSAEKDLNRLSSQMRRRVVAAIRKLADEPRPAGSRKLSAAGNDWRIRVGDYRVIYEVVDTIRVVRVHRIRHRREVYR